MHGEQQYAARALKAGASGYLTKDSAAEDLVPAIRKIARGGGYITPSLAERLAISLNGLHEGPPHTYLTDREFEVMRRLVRPGASACRWCRWSTLSMTCAPRCSSRGR